MNQVQTKISAPILRSLYGVSMFFLGLTGFAQMPIFKRYYIADMPGLGWLAQFYTTHYMHYLGAVLLLGLAAYVLLDYLAGSGRRRTLTASGFARAAMVGALIVSGVFLVVRNRSGAPFHPNFIIFLDLFHLGLVMVFIVTSIYCALRKKAWLR